MRENLLESLALERHQTLIHLSGLPVLQRYGHAAVAKKGFLAVQGNIPFELGHAADSQFRGAVGHQQPDRTGTLELESDAAGVLLVGAEQNVKCGGVAKQALDLRWVTAPVEHAAPGAGEANEAAADVEV